MGENGPMDKKSPTENGIDPTDRAEDTADETGNAGEWTDRYLSETVLAVEPTETNAGVQLTRYDLDDLNDSFMLEVHEYYPPEDGVEGESIFVHGDHAMLKLLAGIAELCSGRSPADPWVSMDDE